MSGGGVALREASEDSEASWELKPNDRRECRSSKNLEVSEVGGLTKSLCGLHFFGGCTVCTMRDDEAVRPYATWEPIEEKGWEPADFLCSKSSRRCGGNLGDEYIEDVDDTTSAEDGVDAAEETDGVRYLGPPGMTRRITEGALQDTPLLREVEAFMWLTGEVFVKRGWSLEALGGDRFRLNGRRVSLMLYPPGAPLPPFAHLQQAVGCEVAERGASFVVSDGSLRQPLLDYLLQSSKNESYDERGTENVASVEGVGRLLEFEHVLGTDDRILEMKSAKLQAEMRRSASGLGAGLPRPSALQSEGAKLLGGRGSIAGNLQTFVQAPVRGV